MRSFVIATPPAEKRLFGKAKGASIKDVLKMCVLPEENFTALKEPNLKEIHPHLKLCKEVKLVKTLLNMDEKQLNNNYKFGVLYAKRGQKTELEFFSNTGAPEAFVKFLDLMADRVTLKGWKKYRAGLDVQDNIHGTHSYYAEWHGHEIMLHVANLIPYTTGDGQQLERKRHIGNDIVVIVFEEEYGIVQTIDDFRSHQNRKDFVSSQFFSFFVQDHHQHSFLPLDIIFVVTPTGNDYHVRLLVKELVPTFEPMIPQEGAILRAGPQFRDLFLYWLVSSERAGYKTPVFSTKLIRTRTMLLKDCIETYLKPS